MILHNLAPEKVKLSLPLDPAGALKLEPLLGEDPTATEGGRVTATLGPYGLRWWRIRPS